jgi:Predicted Fe-S oxidoreductases
MKQEPPFAIQIEPTEGCTLACSFCALQSIRDNGADAELGIHGKNSTPYKFMTVETARFIAREIKLAKWNPRIEFAMHGEPTVNPDLPEIVQMFRKYLPDRSLMVTTNGSGVTTPARIHALFNAGINTLAVDNYKHANFVRRMRDNGCFSLYDDYAYFRYPRDKEGNPHTRYFGERIVVIDDITGNTDGTHKLTNQGGNSFGKTETLHQRCAKPFRELSIRWDGNVALCCDDWKGEYKIGSVNEYSLADLWNHPRFMAARQALYHGKREMMNVCSGCNVKTYRNGLLPDKKGNESLPKPSIGAVRFIDEAQQGKPFSTK